MRYINLMGLVTLTIAGQACAQWTQLGDVTDYEAHGSYVLIRCGDATVRLDAISDQVIRVRLAPQGSFERDFSWAVTDATPRSRFTEPRTQRDAITTSTGALQVVIHRRPCRIDIRDKDGNVLVADDPGSGMAWQTAVPPATDGPVSPRGVRASQRLDPRTAIYGLGEKTGRLNKRGRAWTLWNSDVPAYAADADPLYKSIPFFIQALDGRFCGVFFDNAYRSVFDFGQTGRNVLSFGAEGGELDYYVINGPDPKSVVRRYTELTGRIPLPPKWAIGYHQCRYSYYPEARVRYIASTFRKKHIPCDVLYFDIDYMDGFRCFTWNRRWFPDPAKLMDDLHADGFHTVAIIDPGIKNEPGYFVYDEGTSRQAWLTTPSGQPYVGRVWPGASVFPDFTDPAVRDWWSDLFVKFVDRCHIDGIWNDMNEPADFAGPQHTVPLDVRFDNQGQPASHYACHNVYGMQMHRATFDGLRRARPDRRAFTLTRATFAGGQRYGAAWTGDNVSSWQHLRMSIPMVLNLGVSGMPFVGPDIGGFVGGATPRLYARWIQMASLFPYCRTHTAWPNPDQEPWSFGPQVESVARASLERRYRLLPYLYTLFEEASRTGVPIVRPVWMEFPNWWAHHVDRSFMLGSDIFVSPVTQPFRKHDFIWLPPGAWYDMNTGLVHASGQPVPVPADLEYLPIFARAGAIIPTQSVVQHTGEQPVEPMILDVWTGEGTATGERYEDDGISLKYQSGGFARTRLRCGRKKGVLVFGMRRAQGQLKLPLRSPLLRLHGLTRPIQGVTILSRDGQIETTWSAATAGPGDVGHFVYNKSDDTWLVRLAADDGKLQGARIELGQPGGPPSGPVSIDFTSPDDVLFHSDLLPPNSDGDALRFLVQNTGRVYTVLRRLDVSADRLPMIRLRLATESTHRIGIRFATRQHPTLSDERLIELNVTPDGRVHPYVIDAARVTAGRWAGNVYYLQIDFLDGVTSGETIVLDQVAFEPRR